jgi:hypothetical protein
MCPAALPAGSGLGTARLIGAILEVIENAGRDPAALSAMTRETSATRAR